MKFRISKRLRTVLVSSVVVLGLLFAGLWLTPLPDSLSESNPGSRHIFDRGGLLLARTRGGTGEWYAPLRFEELGSHFVPALLAAEDARFWEHPGVDVLAMARAFSQLVSERRIVSGASTITQQLARSTLPPLTPWSRKLCEIWLSLRIELTLDKEQVLEHYVNHVRFGPQVLGARAAAQRYFGKELRELDLSESATLAGLVRGPSLYNLERRPELAARRRDRVLERMRARGLAQSEAIDRALETPLKLQESAPFAGADHWVRFIQRHVPRADSTRTTLDLQLQREVERLALGHRYRLANYQASALAILVLDRETAEVLAYVGSPDFRDEGALGQNDGVQALRQPGSTLKPFIYAGAVDALGMNEETELVDEPEPFAAPGGHFMPVNYDRQFRGVVSLRRALSNSLNVPAVSVVEKLGLERSLELLRRFGFHSLKERAHVYGPALVLGSGEVTLFELALAYTALGNEGVFRPARFTFDGDLEEPRRACSPRAAQLITRVMADRAARRESFGATQNLEFPFQVAAKTGTSTGFRDAWVAGYSDQVVVAVWVGNFDGRPMVKGSGAGSAGPLFHDVMMRSNARALELWPERKETRARWGYAYFGGTEEPAGNASIPRLIFPKSGMRFARAPRAGPPEIVVRAGSLGLGGHFVIGDTRLDAREDGTALWSPAPGSYTVLAIRGDGIRSEPASITVE